MLCKFIFYANIFLLVLLFSKISYCLLVIHNYSNLIKWGVFLKRIVCLFLFFCVLGQAICTMPLMAGDGVCTERDFMLHIMREMASNEVKLDKELMELARKKNILKDNDVKSLNKILTREKAALYLYRADRVLHDMEKLNEKVTYLKEKKRISDLKDVKKENRATVIKVFWKGIMVGDSNGKYSSSRAFKPKSKVTKKEAEAHCDIHLLTSS